MEEMYNLADGTSRWVVPAEKYWQDQWLINELEEIRQLANAIFEPQLEYTDGLAATPYIEHD
jgi:hypothetical protein